MTLIKSISGIRGTIGGLPSEALTPIDIVKFSCAFAQFLIMRSRDLSVSQGKIRMVVGRDGRISGPMVDHLVVGGLLGMGVDVVELGLSTTPTVEMAVKRHKAQGGIIITASHNPAQWNALKLLNRDGEFIDAEEGKEVIALSENLDFSFAPVDRLGKLTQDTDAIGYHIDKITKLKWVDTKAIRAAGLKVVVDGINSTGGIAVPQLLKALGVRRVKAIHSRPTGEFAHNPEPLPAHLQDLSSEVCRMGADMGISVDPDVDRLAFVCQDGSMFGEEYTLVAVADYVLGRKKGNTVSNMSSSRALRDVTEKRGSAYYSAPVGEVNVVARMKEVGAVIGGEGNGGVILPSLHYGRDALVGVALFLTAFAYRKLSDSATRMTTYRDSFPAYAISKNRIDLEPDTDVDAILERIKRKYASEKMSTQDGIRIDFENRREWVQLRRSNTEPIMRVYAESPTREGAEVLGRRFVDEIRNFK